MFRWLGGLSRRQNLARWVRTAGFASLSALAGSAALAWPPTEETAARIVDADRVGDAERAAFLRELGVLRWHGVGFRGQGVKVAVLDYGFRGYRDKLNRGLPSEVRSRSFRLDGDLEARDSEHGILCAEVVHTLAPEAEILLADWEPDSPESFFRALRWAKSEGARVVSCSVINPNWSDGNGGGPNHAALREILGSGKGEHDVSLFAAAGNLAQRHWAGPLRPNEAGLSRVVDGPAFQHAWLPYGDEPIAVEVYGPPAKCLIEVRDHDSGTLLDVAETRTGGDAANSGLRFEVDEAKRYDIALRVIDRPTGTFQVVVLGGELEIAHSAGSISVSRRRSQCRHSWCRRSRPAARPRLAQLLRSELGAAQARFRRPGAVPESLPQSSVHGNVGGRAAGSRSRGAAPEPLAELDAGGDSRDAARLGARPARAGP